MKKIIITQPDDWHCHLRDGAALATTVPAVAQDFARAIVMPNLKPPITNTQQAQAYYQRIISHCPQDTAFQPLMTLYLTNNTNVQIIEEAAQSNLIYGVKLYPAGATTNSTAGVTDLSHLHDVFLAMQAANLPLLIHGEVTDDDIDIFAREQVFIERELQPLLQTYPKLKIVLEHITTEFAVNFVRKGPENLAATITAHHLWLNRNDLLVGGIRPDFYCLPILKMENDRQALIDAATSGEGKFFLGTDSAPHTIENKYTACGCAGLFTSPTALPLYAEMFDSVNALDKLEAFASFNGADFYGLPRNTNQITLIEQPWQPPEYMPLAEGKVKVFSKQKGPGLNFRIMATRYIEC